MTKAELSAMLAQATQAHTAAGGSIKECAPGERTAPSSLRYCQCGCHGDYTEHSMRAGESGRCASVIIR